MLTVVVGPPCSGKTTYVAARKDPADVVIDLDALAVALGSPDPHDHPPAIRDLARSVRTSLLGSHGFGRTWVIETYPTPETIERYLQAGARFVLVDPGEAVCQERAGERTSAEKTRRLIYEWYRKPPAAPYQERYAPPG